MAWLGRKNGPRTSEITARLGNELFGQNSEALQNEINLQKLTENYNKVVSVFVDEEGRLYYLFLKEGGETVKYFLTKEEVQLLGNDFKVSRKKDFQIFVENSSRNYNRQHQTENNYLLA